MGVQRDDRRTQLYCIVQSRVPPPRQPGGIQIVVSRELNELVCVLNIGTETIRFWTPNDYFYIGQGHPEFLEQCVPMSPASHDLLVLGESLVGAQPFCDGLDSGRDRDGRGVPITSGRSGCQSSGSIRNGQGFRSGRSQWKMARTASMARTDRRSVEGDTVNGPWHRVRLSHGIASLATSCLCARLYKGP